MQVSGTLLREDEKYITNPNLANNTLIHLIFVQFEGAYKMIHDLEEMNFKATANMYNAIMAGYFREKNISGGLRVFKHMKDVNVKPDSQTFFYLIGNCETEEDIIKYCEEMQQARVQATKQIFMALINSYATCGKLEKAKQVLLDPDIPNKSLNEIKSVLVSTLASHGQLSEALLVYEEIKKAGYNLEPKAVISLIQLKDKFENDEIVMESLFDAVFSLIAASESTHLQIGLDLLWAIKDELGLMPSRQCLDFLLSACANAGDLNNARLIWREYEVSGFPYNVLSYLRMYQALLAAGDDRSAHFMLKKIPQDDAEVCSVIIACQKTYNGFNSVGGKKKQGKIKKKEKSHPLAIQVLGSSLFDRNISQWKSALVRFKENKSDNIIDILRLAFDELDNLEKEIFLDIACFLNNEKEEWVMEILDFRGLHPEYGLQILAEKSLITIEDGDIRMHGLLIDLGRCIIREKSPNKPIKWSRLWDYQDLCKVMSDNMESVINHEAIAVEDFLMEFDETTIRADAISKMSKLKFLKLVFLNFCGNLDHLSNELGYLKWFGYPFKHLPSSFQPNNLIHLSLRKSNMKQVWKDKKPLPNLRHLDLAHSKNLIQIPDLGEAPNLRLLDLNGCKKLRQLHPSVGLLTKLTLLNLEKCKSLIKTPHFRENQILETLNLRGCRQLEEINPSIGLLQKLTFLDLERYQYPEYLNRDLYEIREHLKFEVYKYKEAGLNIYGCPELVELECCTSMAFSWTRQILEAHYQYKRPCLSYNDVFPLRIGSVIGGSDIPSWFSNECVGISSLITIDKSPLMQKGNNCIGLACCLVFGPPSGIMAHPEIESNHHFRAEIPLFLGEDQVTKDHLWLFYYALPQSLLTCRDPHWKLEIEITNIESWTFEVKKYGYRWLYDKHLEVSNLIMMPSPNSDLYTFIVPRTDLSVGVSLQAPPTSFRIIRTITRRPRPKTRPVTTKTIKSIELEK
uniref:Disease resistance protein Roq1-like winged-helix domain-containing protein n=1 Tax=Cajanus cajan TaxID=3821 RepID=A0A151SKK1_CAJCA|nr:hypothetical protein KK1_001538 [Cajanus cajan]